MHVQQGDIILVHSKNLTARVIQFGMNLEKWLKFDFGWKKIYNHAAICIVDEVIAEALSTGITTNLLEYAYGNSKGKELVVFRPRLTNREQCAVYYTAIKYKGVKYQFVNFLQYIPKVLFGIWLGSTHKESEDLLYCTEYVALVLHKVTGGKLFPKYWKTSPNDIYEWCKENAEEITTYKFK